MLIPDSCHQNRQISSRFLIHENVFCTWRHTDGSSQGFKKKRKKDTFWEIYKDCLISSLLIMQSHTIWLYYCLNTFFTLYPCDNVLKCGGATDQNVRQLLYIYKVDLYALTYQMQSKKTLSSPERTVRAKNFKSPPVLLSAVMLYEVINLVSVLS